MEETKDLGRIGDDSRVRKAAEDGDLNCDADLGPCKGFNEMKDWNLDGIGGSNPEGQDGELRVDTL
jgi:hypothetical protein